LKEEERLQDDITTLLSNLDIGLPLPSEQSAWHLYAVRLPVDKRKKIFDTFRQSDIWVQVHYIPVHTQPYYKNVGFNWGDFPNAELYFKQALSLPLFVDLKDSEQDSVVSLLQECLL